MKQSLLAVLIITFMVNNPLSASSINDSVSKDFLKNTITMQAEFKNSELILTMKAPAVTAASFRDGYRWGSEGSELPKSTITHIKIQQNKHDIFIPISAYADLGNPRVVTLEQISNGFQVIILGGDASASYRAILTFKDGELLSRRVENAEFPGQAWEETKYSYNPSN